MSPNMNSNEVSMGGPQDPVKATKQGHSFLFCLCDMRTTVLFFDIIHTLSALAGMIALFVLQKYDKEGSESEGVEPFFQDEWTFGAAIGIQAAALAAGVFGIVGAACFAICPLLLITLWIVVYAVLSGVAENWISMGVYIFWLYPHVVLCYELAKRIMTRENYRSQEKQCCCSC